MARIIAIGILQQYSLNHALRFQRHRNRNSETVFRPCACFEVDHETLEMGHHKQSTLEYVETFLD
jgi:hypothetical protein